MLQHLVLSSPQPARLADFYQRAFDYRVSEANGDRCCQGPQRSLRIRLGPANQLLESHFALPDSAAVERYASGLAARGVAIERRAGAALVQDPEGRKVCFAARAALEETPLGIALHTHRVDHLLHIGAGMVARIGAMLRLPVETVYHTQSCRTCHADDASVAQR